MGATAGTTSFVIIGSFICIGLCLLAVAGMVILSIISTFPPNHSQEPYGDEYDCNALMLKTLYTNVSSTFSAGTIANNSQLSDLCTSQLSGQKNFAGCVLQNGQGWGPYNASTTARRRRRATANVGLYSVHKARVFFSTPCQKQGDKNKYEGSSGLSKCVSDRLKIVNGLVNDNAASFIEWTPVSAFILAVLDLTSNYVYITPSQIFGIPRARAATLLSTLPGATTTQQTEAAAGCKYIGQLPMATINAILAASTTQPSQTQSSSPATG